MKKKTKKVKIWTNGADLFKACRQAGEFGVKAILGAHKGQFYPGDRYKDMAAAGFTPVSKLTDYYEHHIVELQRVLSEDRRQYRVAAEQSESRRQIIVNMKASMELAAASIGALSKAVQA